MEPAETQARRTLRERNFFMKSRHNQFWSAVLTDAVKPEVCLDAMFALPCTQIDQATRNGP